MDIQVGRYRLKSDVYAMWVEEEYKTEKSKKTDIDYRRVAGYSTTFPLLLRSFLDKKLRDNDAKDMKEMLEVFTQTYEDILMLKDEAVRKDFRLMANPRKEKK